VVAVTTGVGIVVATPSALLASGVNGLLFRAQAIGIIAAMVSQIALKSFFFILSSPFEFYD
jgi:hypothetical protein